MSFPTSSPTSPSNKTWKFLKEEGKQQFKNGEYTEALVSFQKALKKIEDDPTGSQRRIGILAPKVEREILLSNSVACRLKIGGPEMAYVAVEEAKKCVALNNKWSKAHVRLASAYIALGGHSNDACQSLQNAIRLEPSNSIAKQMLVKELRRDREQNQSNTNVNTNNSNNSNDNNNFATSSSSSSPTYVNEDEYTNNNTRPSAPSQDNDDDNHPNDNHNDLDDEYRNNNDFDIDDSPSLMQRIRSWYHQVQEAADNMGGNGNGNGKTLFKLIILILVLYVAFGGRFGLDSSLSNRSRYGHGTSGYDYGNRNVDRSSNGRKGNYGEGNAYDQFYNNRGRTTDQNRRTETSRRSNNNYDENDYSYNKYGERNPDYRGSSSYGGGSSSSNYGSGSSSSSSSYSSYGRNNRSRYTARRSSSDWDTFIPYLLIGGLVFVLNKFLGVPIQVVPMGFGIGRGLGGFGGRVRLGRSFNVGGGIRFGGGPAMGGFGGARGRFNQRRR